MQGIQKEGKLVLVSCLIVNEKNELLLLYRKDHNYLETPGGKIKPEECKDPNNPTTKELAKAAEREGKEELGKIELAPLNLFVSVEFTIPDGREAIAHKFLTKIVKGMPKIMEPEIFSKIEYVPLKNIDKYPISPDLKLISEKLKKINN